MCSTTLQANCFWSVCVLLVSLKMWSDSLPKCRSIFPEFQRSLKKKRKKKTQKLFVIQRSTRKTGRGSFRRNGKLAGRGDSMITMGWGGRLKKLIRAIAFWGLLARMASALKIKCATLNVEACVKSAWSQEAKICGFSLTMWDLSYSVKNSDPRETILSVYFDVKKMKCS